MRTPSKASLLNKRLKKGYTTGTCAAAAAKAAAKMLFSGETISEIDVMLPGNSWVKMKLVDTMVDKDEARCGVIKDAGDDPDVTDGMVIYAKAVLADSGVKISASEGIGKVTKPGLSVPVGEPAINPVPRWMIEENVKSVMPAGKGIEITLYAPEGVERAKQTLNERLGIVGGISILGTTGVVRPMSVRSLKASLLPQVDIAVASGYKTIALVPGNMGEKVAREKLKFPEDAVVQMSNFVGDVLDYCLEKDIERILIVGHVGKIVKIAAGYLDTHSSKTGSPVEMLQGLVRKATKDIAPVMFMIRANTADEAATGLLKLGYKRILEKIATEASRQAMKHVKGLIEIGTAMTVLSGEVVAQDENAKRIIGEMIW
ncbi:MAG: cobalt-precorrin-5B (C(1))-methyltransferase CbiD [Firmicutes bacterium]|nr:cobalt-precorrin-5B (C(1))-methyltransferase CbiD [Bacillota bacterium]